MKYHPSEEEIIEELMFVQSLISFGEFVRQKILHDSNTSVYNEVNEVDVDNWRKSLSLNIPKDEQ